MDPINLTIDSAVWAAERAREFVAAHKDKRVRVDQVYRAVEIQARLRRARREMEQLLEEGGYACR